MQVKLLLKASGLKQMVTFGKSDTYFVVTVKGSEEQVFKSTVIEKSLEPEWEEATFELPKIFGQKGGDIEVQLVDDDKMTEDELIGGAVTIAYPFRKADHALDTQGVLTVCNDFGELPKPHEEPVPVVEEKKEGMLEWVRSHLCCCL